MVYEGGFPLQWPRYIPAQGILRKVVKALTLGGDSLDGPFVHVHTTLCADRTLYSEPGGSCHCLFPLLFSHFPQSIQLDLFTQLRPQYPLAKPVIFWPAFMSSMIGDMGVGRSSELSFAITAHGFKRDHGSWSFFIPSISETGGFDGPMSILKLSDELGIRAVGIPVSGAGMDPGGGAILQVINRIPFKLNPDTDLEECELRISVSEGERWHIYPSRVHQPLGRGDGSSDLRKDWMIGRMNGRARVAQAPTSLKRSNPPDFAEDASLTTCKLPDPLRSIVLRCTPLYGKS